MRIFKPALVILSLLIVTSCGDGEDAGPQDPAALIIGEWTVQSVTLLGAQIPDGNSSLTFNECATECTGVDYNGNDQTSGEFTYTLSSDGKTVTIVDESEDGGSYGGEWDVETLTSNSFKLKSDSFLGEIGFTLSK